MFILYVFWKAWLPKDAMEQSWNIRKELLLEIASIFRWIFVIIVFFKFSLRVTWNDAIFRIHVNDIYWLSMNRIIHCGYDLIKLGLFNHSNRQIFQNLQTTLRCSSSTSYCENHWGQLFRDLFLFDFLSNLF